jgi:hypothetical protein
VAAGSAKGCLRYGEESSFLVTTPLASGARGSPHRLRIEAWGYLWGGRSFWGVVNSF